MKKEKRKLNKYETKKEENKIFALHPSLPYNLKQNYCAASTIIQKTSHDITYIKIKYRRKKKKNDKTTGRKQPPLGHFWQTVLADRNSHHRI